MVPQIDLQGKWVIILAPLLKWLQGMVLKRFVWLSLHSTICIICIHHYSPRHSKQVPFKISKFHMCRVSGSTCQNWGWKYLSVEFQYRACSVLNPRTLRVQVHNNHVIFTQSLYYNYYYPKPKYLILGYLDPLGKVLWVVPFRRLLGRASSLRTVTFKFGPHGQNPKC